MATERGSRGKYAETQLRKVLERMRLAYHHFTYNRLGDARAGFKVAQPGDFQAFGWGSNWLLEVKEVDHQFRLPVQNFTLDARARMRERQLAGSMCWVLVYFKPAKLWRLQSLDYFGTLASGSWDMRDSPTAELSFVIDEIFGDDAARKLRDTAQPK